jgi:hypothetical protein
LHSIVRNQQPNGFQISEVRNIVTVPFISVTTVVTMTESEKPLCPIELGKGKLNIVFTDT